jgi:hypothetical protein
LEMPAARRAETVLENNGAKSPARSKGFTRDRGEAHTPRYIIVAINYSIEDVYVVSTVENVLF